MYFFVIAWIAHRTFLEEVMIFNTHRDRIKKKSGINKTVSSSVLSWLSPGASGKTHFDSNFCANRSTFSLGSAINFPRTFFKGKYNRNFGLAVQQLTVDSPPFI